MNILIQAGKGTIPSDIMKKNRPARFKTYCTISTAFIFFPDRKLMISVLVLEIFLLDK